MKRSLLRTGSVAASIAVVFALLAQLPAAFAAANSPIPIPDKGEADTELPKKSVEDLQRDAPGIHGRGPPGVEREVRDETADLILGHTIVQGPLHVPPQLIGAIERRQHRHGNEAAIPLGQLRLLPDIAPPSGVVASEVEAESDLAGDVGRAIELDSPVAVHAAREVGTAYRL